MGWSFKRSDHKLINHVHTDFLKYLSLLQSSAGARPRVQGAVFVELRLSLLVLVLPEDVVDVVRGTPVVVSVALLARSPEFHSGVGPTQSATPDLREAEQFVVDSDGFT